MALKTFNIDEAVYKNYSKHCKNHGISMSKQVEKFLQIELGKLKSGMKSIGKSVKKIEKTVAKELVMEHPLSKYC